MSYGTESWGLDVWGADAAFVFDNAVAATTHSVYVTFSRAPRAVSPLSIGDVLRLATWSIHGVGFTDNKIVVAARMVSNRRAEIIVSTPFKSSNYIYRISAPTLMSASRVYVSPPYDLDFRGLLPADPITDPNRTFDLKNSELIGGSFEVTSAGTYARVYGVELLRKMIFRRLSTMPGSFFHLTPDEFGLGIRSKELLRFSAIPTMKRKIEDEINKEPGITGTVATVDLKDGLLSVKLKVQTEGGLVETTVFAR